MRSFSLIFLFLPQLLLSASVGSDSVEQRFCRQALKMVLHSISERERKLEKSDAAAVLADRHTKLIAPILRRGSRHGAEIDEYFRIREDSVEIFRSLPLAEISGLVRDVEKLGGKLYFDPLSDVPGIEINDAGDVLLVMPAEGIDERGRLHELAHIRDIFIWKDRLQKSDSNLSDSDAVKLAYVYLATPEGIQWLELRAIRAEFEADLARTDLPRSVGMAGSFIGETIGYTTYPDREALARCVLLRKAQLESVAATSRAYPVAQSVLRAEVENEFKTLVTDISRKFIRRHLEQRKTLAKLQDRRARNAQSLGLKRTANAYREEASILQTPPSDYEEFFETLVLPDDGSRELLKPIFDDVLTIERNRFRKR